MLRSQGIGYEEVIRRLFWKPGAKPVDPRGNPGVSADPGRMSDLCFGKSRRSFAAGL